MIRAFSVLTACVAVTILAACPDRSARAADLFVEAESFETHGGWKLDTQFITEMGSPYLLAHGLGQPVADAFTEVTFPQPGTYNVFVRTKDWTARWDADGSPGRFRVAIDDQPLETVFGTEGKGWMWQRGGAVEITDPTVKLSLKDLTGFDGRCDAIYFTTEDDVPPVDDKELATWRLKQLGLTGEPILHSDYDIVVIGGGYAGMATALSASRMGCRVALIQNRPVLGGNGSSEVRVWSMGLIRRGKFPRIGEIVDEFADNAKKSPGTYEEFGDAKKEAIIRAEDKIDLFLNHHADRVETEDGSIVALEAFDTRSGARKRFTGRFFADCTGHGTIGFLAGADWKMIPKGRMGMSNMWRWDNKAEPVEFPETPWALDLNMGEFPYPRDFHGQWFWESGFDKDPINNAEGIRDWNLRAVYGAFNAMKNRQGASSHRNATLTWVAYIGGPRESRQLMGDVLLTQEDIVTKRQFKDGCVPSTWSIDLHEPKKQYAKKFPDNPFISIAIHDRRVDRNYGYPVPYRCFYSKDIDNLFMAGRCISVTHEALGTVRVMKTCGMMGEVVGKAVSICVEQDCSPREVYTDHWGEMEKLLRLPGKARRSTPGSSVVIPNDALPLASPYGPMPGLDPKKLPGLVVDDRQAERTGKWTEGTGLKGFVGWSYLYAGSNSKSTVTFRCETPEAGKYEVRLRYLEHENRGPTVPVVVTVGTGSDAKALELDMRKKPPIDGESISLGTWTVEKGTPISVRLSTAGAGGNVHADAIQVLRTDK